MIFGGCVQTMAITYFKTPLMQLSSSPKCYIIISFSLHNNYGNIEVEISGKNLQIWNSNHLLNQISVSLDELGPGPYAKVIEFIPFFPVSLFPLEFAVCCEEYKMCNGVKREGKREGSYNFLKSNILSTILCAFCLTLQL